jgi:hypothetical protein
VKTLDRLHVSKGKTVNFVNSACAVNLALEGTTCQKLRRILWYDPTDPRNLAELKLRRIIRYLRWIERWIKEEHQEPPSRRRKDEEL